MEKRNVSRLDLDMTISRALWNLLNFFQIQFFLDSVLMLKLNVINQKAWNLQY